MRVGLFIPCYIDAFFPKVGIATLELLERFGHDVHYPRDQTCCGGGVFSRISTRCRSSRKPP
jgi:L-lactate dehydrogenase complex protein LldE